MAAARSPESDCIEETPEPDPRAPPKPRVVRLRGEPMDDTPEAARVAAGERARRQEIIRRMRAQEAHYTATHTEEEVESPEDRDYRPR